MNAPTAAQENSLNKLFHGNQTEQERVIALQRPELQEVLKELVKTNRNTELLLQIMFKDLLRANDEMLKNPDDQFWRRATIRAFAATVEGVIFCLKQTALVNGKLANFSFNESELFFLTEKNDGLSKKKYRFPSFQENVKETFNLAAKIHKIQCPVDFGHPGFKAFCETYELRHRLIHPKNFMTFCVSDEERDRCKVAGAWLDRELHKLLDKCSESSGLLCR